MDVRSRHHASGHRRSRDDNRAYRSRNHEGRRMSTLGRKPKLTFSEQVKLRTIQAAYGVGSAEEDAFWTAIRKGRAAMFDRKRKYGKQTAEERKIKSRQSSLDYQRRHKDDPKFKETHRKAANAWYQRHKNDPGFKEKQRKYKLEWLARKKEAK